jgi:hypothetical protein
MLAAIAAPAGACLSEPLPEAILFDGPPKRPPPGYAVIRVVASVAAGEGEPLRVNFLDPGQRRQFGPAGWIFQERPSSCTGWGRLGAPAFAIARPAGSLRGRVLLAGKAYRRRWWDRFWNFLGITQYSAD